MKAFIWACWLSTLVLLGCGGGGGDPGACSGSTEYCAEYSPTSGGSNTGGNAILAGGFTKTGVGDTVFSIPSNVTRIRIQATYAGDSSQFVVKAAGSLLVNELIGTSWSASVFEGTYVVTGGSTMEITNSSGVNWTITQVVADTVPANPTGLYANTGIGDTVFSIPSNVTKIRIQATYAGDSSQFVVKVAGSLLVNELIGTSWPTSIFDKTFVFVGDSTVEISNSSGVAWTFTEVP